MRAFLRTNTQTLYTLEFGPSIDPVAAEDLVPILMKDYPRRDDELLALGTSPAIQPLFKSLVASGRVAPEIVKHLNAIGRFHYTETAHAVAQFLDYPDASVQREAIIALGRIGSFQTRPGIENFLNHPDYGLRAAAITALSRFLEPFIPDQLHEAAGDNPECQALAQMAENRWKAFQDQDWRRYTRVVIESTEFEDLIFLIEAVEQYVREILDDPASPPELRRRAIWILSIRPTMTAQLPMIRILHDEAQPVPLRREAAFAMGRLKVRSEIPYLGERIPKEPLPIAEAAVRAIGRMRHAKGAPYLIANWDSHDGKLQPDIELALVRCFEFPSDALIAAFRDNPALAIEQAWFVDEGMLIDTYPREILHPALASQDAAVRRDAILLIALWGAEADANILRMRARSEVDELNKDLALKGADRLHKPGA